MGKVRNHHFYVCSHTHWDREWYGSFEDFRMRLVEMADELLDYLEDEPEFRCFNFDGQTIVLGDYLDIRPQRRDDIRRFVSEGRLAVGPWYILPDEFLVSGEAFVRNLAFGHRIAGEFGRVSKVGYLPDCFGHISQIPQILQGFGIDTFVFWRGYAPEEDRPEVTVEGADGTRVLAYHFGAGGYCQLAFFSNQSPPDVQDMIEGCGAVPDWSPRARFLALKHIAEKAVERDQSRVHLIMNGCDHQHIVRDLPEVLRRANEECEGWTFHHATLEEFFEALKEERGSWPVARAPFRSTARDLRSAGFILQGVLSSRVYLKQANQRCQTLLERWVAPWKTIQWIEGGGHGRPFIERAWELLLQNHPHDSICGCSVDAVHRHMETRFERCEEIGRQLLRRAQTALATRIDSTAFAEPYEGVLVVFNPEPRPVSRLVEARLEMDAKDVRVVDSADKESPKDITFEPLASASEVARAIRGVRLFDPDDREIALGCESIDVEVTNEPYAQHEWPSATRNRLVARVRFWADELPALGYRAYRFHFLNRPVSPAGGLITGPDTIENEHLRVSVGADGAISITDKSASAESTATLHFEDSADCGDSYNFAAPIDDRIVPSLGGANVRILEDSPAAAVIEVERTLEIPERYEFEAGRRSERTVPVRLTTRITLGAHARYATFKSRLKNTACDHRLRAVIRPANSMDKEALASFAEGPFDVVEWPIQPPHPKPAAWIEDQPATIPQQSFVVLTDGGRGLAVFNKGLPEVEIERDPAPRICLTLFRSFGHISRPDNPARARPAGPCIETPEGQCLREMEFEFAVHPHAGAWHESGVQALAHEFVNGVSAISLKPRDGDRSPERGFVQLEAGGGVALSTIDVSADGEAVLVRIWNGTDEKRDARLVFDRDVRSASLVRLNETVEEALKVVRGNQVPLKLGPKKIATVRVAVERAGV